MKVRGIEGKAGTLLAAIVLSFSAIAAEAPSNNGQDLAAKLSALRQEGPTYVRLRLEIKQPGSTTRNVLQLQLKARRSRSTTDLVYQVLWPKERKGESILLTKTAGQSATGFVFVPPNKLRLLNSAQLSEPVFGTDLSYADLIENFFAWPQQSLAGNETIDGVNCTLLESRAGKGDRSIYAKVRSWIDPARLVPLRIEKFSAAGDVIRRIDASKIVKDDSGRLVPARLTIHQAGHDSETELEGTSSRRVGAYEEKEFTPDGIKELTVPRFE